MIRSMTGFGKCTLSSGKTTVEVETKSVNSRFVDISMRLPSALVNREYEIRDFIKTKIKRGKVSISIQLKKNGDDENGLIVDKEKLKNYLTLIKEIKKNAKITEKVKLEHILLSKDIYSAGSLEYSEEEFSFVKKALDSALDELTGMKKKEGKELANDLIKRVKIIEQRLDDIENDAALSINEYYEKLKERIKLLLEDSSIDQERLALELALIAEKADITEECVRMRSHIKFFLESIDAGEEPGRKLNFLCQELNRETNTISSKSISTAITHNAVIIKEEIEKIREQIQNIE